MSHHTFSIGATTCEIELVEFEFSTSPSLQNADFFVRLSSGERYFGVVATVANLEHLLMQADRPDSGWLAINGLVIVPAFTSQAIFRAIERLVREDAHTWALAKQSDGEANDT